MAVMTMEMESPAQTEVKKEKMGLPYVTSFCCCFGLEMGAKVVAYLHLLISVSLVIICSIFAENFRALVGTADDAGDELYTKWYHITVTITVFSTGHVLLAAILLYGVYKRSTAALRTWVWTMCVLFVAALVSIVISSAMTGVAHSGSDMFLAFLQALLFFGILAYCILVVYSFYLMVRSCEDMEGPGQPY